MTFEGEGGASVPPRKKIVHYHGDEVRVLFFVAALVLIIAQSTGAELPLSMLGSIGAAILLVIAAGITNPAQSVIHWFNALLSIAGVLLFGSSAVEYYRAGLSLLDPSFTYTEALAIISLVTLYFATRTIRGNMQRPKLS